MRIALAGIGLLVALALGCVGELPNEGLVMHLQADPPAILENGIVKLHVDVTNTDVKRLDDVTVEIFNPGQLSYEPSLCRLRGRLGQLLPDEFRSFSCDLWASTINQDRITTSVDAKATFVTEFAAVQLVPLITETEYQNRQASTGVESLPQGSVYRDRNIELKVEFSEPPPLVIKAGRPLFVKFTLKNIGNGFINPIRPQDFTVLQKPTLEPVEQSNILQTVDSLGQNVPCALQSPLLPIGKEFPSFTCQIFAPASMPPQSNFNFIITVRYTYEIRDRVAVSVIR